MEQQQQQPPPAAAAQTPTAAPSIPQEQERAQQLAWASPPRPPFAHGGVEKNEKRNDGASGGENVNTTSSTSTSSSDSALASAYSRKLVELRALVADAHFRGKDLAGKDEIHEAAVSAGGAQFACSADPQQLRRFLAAPKLAPELEKWLDPDYQGDKD